jgi:hypothetical protein
VAAPAEVALFRVLAEGVPPGPHRAERRAAYEALARAVVFERDVVAGARVVFDLVVVLAGLYEVGGTG